MFYSGFYPCKVGLLQQTHFYFLGGTPMTEATTPAKIKQERVPVTAFIGKDTRDALLHIAAEKDLTLSDIVRAACNEYAKKNNEN